MATQSIVHGPYNQMPDMGFTPDGQVVIAARRNGAVYVDGVSSPVDRWIETTRGTREHAIYTLLEPDGHRHLVVDGKEYPACDEIRAISVSDDGLHAGYAARMSERWYAIADAKEYGPFDVVSMTAWSLDASTFAFMATKGGDESLYVEGQLKGTSRHKWGGGINLSPDGSHAAFAEQEQRNLWLRYVVDRHALSWYDSVEAMSFSPDSSHYCYVARPVPLEERFPRFLRGAVSRFFATRTGQYVVVDRARFGPFDRIGAQPRFTSDSRHVWWTYTDPGGLTVYVDGEPMAHIKGSVIAQAEADSLQCVVRDGSKVSVVEVRIESLD